MILVFLERVFANCYVSHKLGRSEYFSSRNSKKKLFFFLAAARSFDYIVEKISRKTKENFDVFKVFVR